MPRSAESLTTIPNLLSLSRLPLAGVLCFAIHERLWLPALIVFSVAAVTDWLDGFWARRFNLTSRMGRSVDPLTDKILLGCGFIFLQSANVGVEAWMVAVMIARELWVTGLRGMVEATGAKFGADWFGKLKTVLQFAALFAVFITQTWPESPNVASWLLWAAVLATLGSGVQYTVKALRLLR